MMLMMIILHVIIIRLSKTMSSPYIFSDINRLSMIIHGYPNDEIIINGPNDKIINGHPNDKIIKWKVQKWKV